MPLEPKVNILLVDDHPANLLALEAILESLGQNLVKANSGEEALKCLLHQEFAVILLDVQMPGIDGFKTAELIRSRQKTQRIPIIFLTAFNTSETLMFKGYSVGAVDYLFKPIVQEILLAKVLVFIDLYRKTAEVERQAAQLAQTNRILEQARAELESRVETRTAELAKANEELRAEITERQRAEAALRENEEQLRLITDALPVLIGYIDSDQHYRFNNRAYEDWFQQPRADITGKSIQQVLGESAYQTIAPHIKTALAGEKVSFETVLFYQDGSHRWINATYIPHFSLQGNVKGFFSLVTDIHDRKQAELVLRESEERFRSMADSAPVLIWMTGTDALSSFFNQTWLTFRGRKQEEEMGLGWTEGVHPDDLQHCRDTFLSAFSACRSFEMEYRLQRADGDYRWVLDQGTPRFLGDGSFAGYIGSCIDIADRKQLEETLHQTNAELEQRVAERTEQLLASNKELRQSETRYRAIVEDQTELITRYQADGTLTFVNEAYCRYFGQQQQTLLGSHYKPLVVAEDQNKVARLIGSMTPENPVVTVENRVIVAGKVRWTQWNNRMIVDQQGNFVEFQAVGRDITELKQAEEALQESQRFIQKIADTAPVTLYVYDLFEARTVYINREITNQLGYPSEPSQATVSAMPQAILHPEDRSQALQQQRWEHAKDGEILQTEYRLKHHNGEWRYFQCQETLFVRTPEGTPKQILGAAIDITTAKRLEEVRKAEEQLQVSLREKEVLLKEIYHRVKNNLQIISSLFNLQTDHVSDPQALEVFKESQNRIESMALIHEKLYQSEDLARIEFSDYLKDLVESLLCSYGHTLSHVQVSIHTDTVLLNIDTGIPCGLLINELVSNAFKYAFPNNKQGEIKIGLHLSSDNQFVLTIQDNGVGLPASLDFRQTETLGLQLVNALVGQLQGEIELLSGVGTGFRITFKDESSE